MLFYRAERKAQSTEVVSSVCPYVRLVAPSRAWNFCFGTSCFRSGHALTVARGAVVVSLCFGVFDRLVWFLADCSCGGV